MERIIICDLDGTLCNCDHRIHLAKQKRWDEYNAACVDDPVYEDIANILRNLASKRTKVYIVTGRDKKFKEQTNDWLFLNDIPYDRLYMREEGDRRSDFIIKEEILMRDIYAGGWKDKPDIWFVLDDRQSVVDMWRNNQLRCLQVQKGDF